MVWLDYGSFLAGPLLCVAGDDGTVDVPGLQNDADDEHRSAAADDDEDYASDDGRNFYDFANFQRLGGVHSDQQRGGYRAAVVLESHAPGVSADASKNHAREKVLALSKSVV